jgi:hypothetical protein
VCGPGVVKRYVSKISGPLLDRIDLHVEVTPVSYDELTTTERPKLNSREIRARVLMAREVQALRFKDLPEVYCNAQMPSRMVHEVCRLQPQGLQLRNVMAMGRQMTPIEQSYADIGGLHQALLLKRRGDCESPRLFSAPQVSHLRGVLRRNAFHWHTFLRRTKNYSRYNPKHHYSFTTLAE